VARQDAPPEPAPSFDVVSIRESSDSSTFRSAWTPGRFVAGRAPLLGLISQAYGGGSPVRIDGDDPVLRTQWDIQATFVPAVDATPDQRAAMLRTLLEDRFQLVLRVDTRETEVYALMLARDDGRLGPGFQPSELPCESPPRAGFTVGKAPPEGLRPACGPPVVSVGPLATIIGGDIPLEYLTRPLSSLLERPVVDRTGLSGTFDLVLQFAWDSAVRPSPIPVEQPPEPVGAPNIFTALREQLGLTLESTRAPLDYHVVERVEMPAPN
jgi:uncharacterized protein (TIGR03435 family)